MSTREQRRPGLPAGIILLILLLLWPSAAGAAVYQWIDDAGVAHFTDDPARVPEAHRDAAMAAQRGRAARLTEQPADTPGPPAPAEAAPPAAAEEAEESAAEEEAQEEALSPLQEAVEETGADVDNYGHDKRYWQDRKRFWEHRLQTSERLLEETRREFNLINQRFDKREYKQMKALRERMRELEADVAQARAMLDGGLAKDARRAGAQPGWIR